MLPFARAAQLLPIATSAGRIRFRGEGATHAVPYAGSTAAERRRGTWRAPGVSGAATIDVAAQLPGRQVELIVRFERPRGLRALWWSRARVQRAAHGLARAIKAQQEVGSPEAAWMRAGRAGAYEAQRAAAVGSDTAMSTG